MEELAILGGRPVTEKNFNNYNTIGEEEKEEVLEVLDSGVLSAFIASPGDFFLGGEKVRKLEQEWADYFSIAHAVSMNSATSALIAAISACEIGPGDEVIVPPLTMCATATAVLANNAVPVFADVDPETMNISPAAVEKLVNKRTKAIMVVHLAGFPCDMDEIMAIAGKHNLYVVEDNAQAPGALYKGEFAGCIGHIGVFSLNCHKTIQSGEGGIAVTNDSDLALKLQLVRNHGEKCVAGVGLEGKFDHIGYNFRMTELEAAVAIHQLRKLEYLNDRRIKLADYLTERLNNECSFIRTPCKADDRTHVYYIYHMQYDEKAAGIPLDLFAKAVQAEGIPLYSRWGSPIYTLPVYQRRNAYGNGNCPFEPPYHDRDVSYPTGLCPNAELSEETSLFMFAVVRWPQTTEDMDNVVSAINKVVTHKEKLLQLSEHVTCE
ncbi:DegT/DnrJ/EryC1/StrS aminotransferase family protein [Desulfovibrio sp. JC010]|uniref:DegT/DnrJ/EryC1/StrS family aminotransferase n=1 Tax=Desulfovibrio sp. JC010 TaxID=2593641 RepID=UPI0013D00476|nr:DegT/DnrJ/EryC1/StrS family aminotransferase [Desulfovibrio sp. JC010]NDV26697.1 DegT/DnrJ/EryC1/StrS family aminotransferase [Desulfovibrio sp. JC010]